MTDTDRSATANLTKQYERQVGRVAEHLRHLADEIEKVRVHPDLNDKQPSFDGAAREIESALRWGYANMPLGALLGAATDIDRWIRSPGAD